MRPLWANKRGATACRLFFCVFLFLACLARANSTDAGQPTPDTVANSPSVIAATQLATVDVIADLIATARSALKATAAPCGPGAIPGALPSKPLPYGVDETFVIDIINSTEPFLPIITPPAPSPASEVDKILPSGTNALAFGGGPLQIPYTTRSAGAAGNSPGPTLNYPWAPTGLLSVKFPNQTFPVTCTASLIAPGLAVTAAQCLYNYGSAAFPNGAPATEPSSIECAWATYDRAGNGSVDVQDSPYGTWVVQTLPPAPNDKRARLAIYLPPVWINGTDTCTAGAGGAAPSCANDVAVIVLAPDGLGVLPGEYTGYYGVGYDGYGASESFYGGARGTRAWLLTTLSYPPNFDAKTRQVRTDGPAIQRPGDISITRGTGVLINDAGGPWLSNFGAADPDTGLPSNGLLPNVVVGVSAGGRVLENNSNNSGQTRSVGDTTFKIQSAAPFATNAAFPDLPNIVALIQEACDALQPEDRVKVCADRAKIAENCRSGAGGGAAPAVPHTTAGAYSYQYSAAPDKPTVQAYVATATSEAPWNAAGKLTITLADGGTVERSAALIGPGLVLTAAEALVPYGQAPQITSMRFEPARFDDNTPLGSWESNTFAVPAAWANGTDQDANYALIALTPDDKGQLPGSSAIGGSFFALPPSTAGNFSFTSQFFPADSNAAGALAAQVTVLAYPSGGKRMSRTDGVATTLRLAGGGGGQTPGRYEMGSAVGEGGIGGVWVANFGAPFADEKYRGQVVPSGADAAGNVAVGVTGWWRAGIQGSSDLGTDFFELVDAFCAGLGEQRGAVCGKL